MAINWEKTAIVVDEKEIIILADDDTVNASCGKSIIFTVHRESSGSGEAVWGEITGVLAAQLDLQTALDAKANTADLGDLAYKDDAPSDGKQYARKDGAWDEVVNSGGAVWGEITGDLEDQTDLQTELDNLATVEDLDVTHIGVNNEFYVGSGKSPTYITASIPLKQSGSGTPSSENIRPFLIPNRASVKEYRGMNYLRWTTLLPDGAGFDLDFLTGEGKMEYGRIASYNGENLSLLAGSETVYWWSDRDDPQSLYLYPNHVPTVGAEVVFRLKYPVIFKVTTPSQLMNDVTYAIESWNGTTAITVPDTVVTYALSSDETKRTDIKTYIDTNDDSIMDDLLDMATRVNILFDSTIKGDAPSDGVTYGRKDGSWSPVSGGGGGGDAVWGLIQGTLSNQTDLQTALNAKANTSSLGTMATVNDASSDNHVYGRKNGGWESIPNLAWGNISGTLSHQNDLQNALNAKPDTTDLGAMAFEADAHIDGKQYARKNGAWVEVEQGITNWGSIVGTLSNQSDLQAALDEKADSYDLGSLAYQDTIDYSSNQLTNKPILGTMASKDDAASDGKQYARKNGSWAEVVQGATDWGDIGGTLSDQTDLNAALAEKADSYDLGSLAYKDTVDYTTEVTNKPTLGSLASKNSVDYSTNEVTNKPTLGTMAAVNDASSDNKTYGRKNGAWSEIAGTSWGDITGTLSNQTDLQNALDAKANTTNVTSNIETSMSATQAYSIGDLIFVAGTLYRATASISSGSSLVVGTNVAVATVEDLLALKADSSALSSYAPLASPDLTGSPTAPTQTAGDNSTKIATTAYVDSGLSGKSDTGHTHDDRYYTETEIDEKFGKEIQYYSAQTVSVASGAQIMRIPSSGTSESITTDTVVLNCTFANPANITSNVTWTSYAGYITFSGTCTTATTADVTIGQKGN